MCDVKLGKYLAFRILGIFQKDRTRSFKSLCRKFAEVDGVQFLMEMLKVCLQSWVCTDGIFSST